MKPTIWIEKTLVSKRLDRKEGNLAAGKALWSPQRARGDRDVYANMRDVKKGDVILHLVDNTSIRMITTASSSVDTSFITPENTEWGGQKGYLINLENCVFLEKEISRDDFFSSSYRSILDQIRSQNEGLFYNRKFEFNQGSYLTKCPDALAAVFNEIYLKKCGKPLPHLEWLTEKVPEIEKLNNNKNPIINSSEVIASIAKPFLILTGNSGTGKTRVAEVIAVTYRNHEEVEKATNSALVPVGADWTDSRAVVGFVNHLREVPHKGSAEKWPVYQTTPVVDLLLAAHAVPHFPHFLILDEMNLSHVERYFSDFLSAMESREGRIRFHDEGPRDQKEFRLQRFEGDPVGVPRSIAYPRNLFVIGTVNIDETTYMFSPKVLDRAHVIEFVVDRDDISVFLDNPVSPQPAEKATDAQSKAFLQLALDARGGKLAELPVNVRKSVNKHLMDWLDLLQAGRFEFAYRTANEVLRYLRICHVLAEEQSSWCKDDRLSLEDRKTGKRNWLSDLDDEILQKILPRLHGSRIRIGPLLGALACYANCGDKEQSMAYFPRDNSELADKSIGDPEFTGLSQSSALFPRSFQKLKTMCRVLVEEQFVSFIC